MKSEALVVLPSSTAYPAMKIGKLAKAPCPQRPLCIAPALRATESLSSIVSARPTAGTADRRGQTQTASTSEMPRWLHGSSEGAPASLQIPAELLPRHIAVIMDGNARWSQARRLPTNAGHEAGVNALRRSVSCCMKWGIPALTVYAFSAENWKRAEEETSFILGLVEHMLMRELDYIRQKGICLRFIGTRDNLPVSLQRLMTRAEADTAGNTVLQLTLALSYGGRQDIVQAAQQLAQEVADGQLLPSQVTEEAISQRLGLGQLPNSMRRPDLLIRTSGEMRVSNFLLWELAYCEIYFTHTKWPDFGEADFRAALHDFSTRQRRYGQRLQTL